MLSNGTIEALPDRKLTEKTTRFYNYTLMYRDGARVEISSFYRDGNVVAQKLRGPNKAFQWRGDTSKPQRRDQHLWKSKGGKRQKREAAAKVLERVYHVQDPAEVKFTKSKYAAVGFASGEHNGLIAHYNFRVSKGLERLNFPED